MSESAHARRRSLTVVAALSGVWLLLAGWQFVEHTAVRKSTRAALVNRGRDITTTLGLVVRSQRRFGGIVSKERLESALAELVTPGELNSVALLNAAGEIVASAGAPINLGTRSVSGNNVVWDEHGLLMANLIDLGTNVSGTNAPPNSLTSTNPTIIVTRDFFAGFETNRAARATGEISLERTNRPSGNNSFRPWFGGWNSTNGTPRPPPRPPWMSETDYQSLIQRQGLHSIVIAMSAEALHETMQRDLWQRLVIGLLAAISVIGSGLAWRNLVKSSELQLRLVRASEQNLHLKEMNLAAAGLAHETRNPLNIVRGLAQMISKEANLPAEIQRRSREIIDETDRVTAQLNEFINYSRPREVRRTAVAFDAIAADVIRALGYDLEEKFLAIAAPVTGISVEADEQLLRQTLFNLLLNAVQAVAPKGEIILTATRSGPEEATLEIRDNGPGVPPDQRQAIFKPYVTTNQKGTGLGLAVVQQIVAAHGWEIVCLGNEPRGAIFRLSHVRLARANS